jgi:hypothetical protein
LIFLPGKSILQQKVDHQKIKIPQKNRMLNGGVIFYWRRSLSESLCMPTVWWPLATQDHARHDLPSVHGASVSQPVTAFVEYIFRQTEFFLIAYFICCL